MTKHAARYYVYVYYDPRPDKDNQPFYVGKGQGRRSAAHLSKTEAHRNFLMRGTLTKIIAAGLNPVIKIVKRFEIEAEAFEFEIELIAQYGRRDLGLGSLCNLTDGGEGHSGNLATIERGRRMMLDRWKNPTY